MGLGLGLGLGLNFYPTNPTLGHIARAETIAYTLQVTNEIY